MKFRKKPIIVEAEQFHDPLRTRELPVGVNPPMRGDAEKRYYVVTAHGQQAFLEDGDWVIAEPDGRGYYPCKPDIFQATYEKE
jgi:hypothetical protein